MNKLFTFLLAIAFISGCSYNNIPSITTNHTASGSEVPCTDGTAKNHPCDNVDLISFLDIQSLGGTSKSEMSDVWGWTDPQTGNEYAIAGRTDGTAFVDITNPENPIYLGNLPLTKGANPSFWRDIKVYKNYAFIVADNAGNHGMQIFDLTQLRTLSKYPVTFTTSAHYTGFESAHNVAINEESGYAYAVGINGGGNSCGGGLHMINIQNPLEPTFVGCFSHLNTGTSGTGNTHDVQCVTYKGPDTKYRGHEICVGSNETAISIADVTNKNAPKALAIGDYPESAYIHQGWLTEDHRYFYQNDELDEMNGKVQTTRTLIWDLSELEDPQLVGSFYGRDGNIDHNLYIKGDVMYQSNYTAGLRVIDIKNRTNPTEVGYFDTFIPDNKAEFNGAWSVFPYFKSGTVLINSIGEGLFMVRPKLPVFSANMK